MLGVLPGVIGSLQASEALKLALGIGEPLVGRLLLFDALAATFDEVKLRRDPDCPVCGEHPTITEYIDYVEFCAGTRERRMTKVRIPPTLREQAGGQREVAAEGDNGSRSARGLMRTFSGTAHAARRGR